MFSLGWRRRRILFHRRFRVLRRWRSQLSFKVKGIRYKIRRGGTRMKIKYRGKWRPLKRIRNIWYILIRKLQRIHRRGRQWTIRRKKQYIRLPRTPRTFRILFQRKWRPFKCTGGRYFIYFKRHWWPVKRSPRYTIRYRSKRLVVKKKNGLFRVRWRGRYGKLRRGKITMTFQNSVVGLIRRAPITAVLLHFYRRA